MRLLLWYAGAFVVAGLGSWELAGVLPSAAPVAQRVAVALTWGAIMAIAWLAWIPRPR